MAPSEMEELRLQLGVSVSEMAAISGASPRDLQNVEAGRNKGTRWAAAAVIRKLLHGYKRPPDWLQHTLRGPTAAPSGWRSRRSRIP